MKNHKIILFFCLLLIGSSCFAFADDTEDISEPVPDNIDSPATVVVDITQLLSDQMSAGSDNDTPEDVKVVDPVEIMELQLVDMTQTKTAVTPSDASGFKAVLLTILGDYETVVTDYEYRNNNNTYMSHSIQIEQDYAWICSAAMLGLIVYCTFRIIGGMLCKR